MRFSATAILLLCSGVAAGQQVYRSVGPDGEVRFSDQGGAGAEKIKVAPLPTYDAPPQRPAAERAPAKPKGYASFALLTPANGQTLRDDTGEVPVTVAIQPPLRAGDRIDVIYDGRFIGPDKALSRVLRNIERGTHSVQAVVVDGSGRELARTQSATFQMHRNRGSQVVPANQAPLAPQAPQAPKAPRPGD